MLGPSTPKSNGMRSWRAHCAAVFLLGIASAGPAAGDDATHDTRVHDIMIEELEPAAEIIWDSAGWILTADGEVELWPTTDDGWAAVAAGANQIAAIARTLAQPAYAEGLADWAVLSEQLEITARRAKRAAETHDKDGLFNVGGHLYLVCVACHERHMIGTED